MELYTGSPRGEHNMVSVIWLYRHCSKHRNNDMRTRPVYGKFRFQYTAITQSAVGALAIYLKRLRFIQCGINAGINSFRSFIDLLSPWSATHDSRALSCRATPRTVPRSHCTLLVVALKLAVVRHSEVSYPEQQLILLLSVYPLI